MVQRERHLWSWAVFPILPFSLHQPHCVWSHSLSHIPYHSLYYLGKEQLSSFQRTAFSCPTINCIRNFEANTLQTSPQVWTSDKPVSRLNPFDSPASHGIPYAQVKETNALNRIVLTAVVVINKVVVFTHKTFWKENFYGIVQRSQADQSMESTNLHQVSVQFFFRVL